jgi:hypothetical protein
VAAGGEVGAGVVGVAQAVSNKQNAANTRADRLIIGRINCPTGLFIFSSLDERLAKAMLTGCWVVANVASLFYRDSSSL